MTIPKELARQALKALENRFNPKEYGEMDKAIAALRQALENHESAYQRGYLDGMAKPCIDCADRKLQAFKQPKRKEGCAECGKLPSDGWALYCVKCSEPMREWVGLTDEEIDYWVGNNGSKKAILAVEAILKEKNA